MGAWGNRNFENDQAMDLIANFTDNPSLESLEAALTIVIDLGKEGEYIEVDEASAALAAAEIVAATLQKSSSDFPEDLQPVLAAIGSDVTIQKLARKAVKQVAKEFELQELWAEGNDADEWQLIQKELLERLK